MADGGLSLISNLLHVSIYIFKAIFDNCLVFINIKTTNNTCQAVVKINILWMCRMGLFTDFLAPGDQLKPIFQV